MLKDHEARVKFRTGKMWDDLHLRPLFRAIHGQANTLRKMGRYREALAKYLLLEKYDSNWYTTRYGYSVPVLPMTHRTHRIRPHTAHRTTAPHRATYANYRYHMPAVYLALGNTEAASRYLARWAEQGYSLSSTSTHAVMQ
jgi:tetratricopeptide (TPR) repeat protein